MFCIDDATLLNMVSVYARTYDDVTEFSYVRVYVRRFSGPFTARFLPYSIIHLFSIRSLEQDYWLY
jgi:hypothetical protein